MKKKRLSSLQATAFHEAGHAVLAYAFRRRVLKVSIEPGQDFHGFTESNTGFGRAVAYDNSPRMRRLVEEEIRVLLAGPIAQRQFAPRSWRKGHGSSDFERAAGYVLRNTGSSKEANAYMRRLENETVQMVKQEFHQQIAAVADALLKRRTLTWRDVQYICPYRRGVKLR